MRRLGLGVSLALVAIGIWLLEGIDAGFESASVPWGGMALLALGLAGLVMCVLSALLGRDLKIRRSPTPVADRSATGDRQPTHQPTMKGRPR